MNADGDGLLEAWKIELVLERVRRVRFPSRDRADVGQELLLKVWRFQFEPAKSNGAKEATVLRMVVDRALISKGRSERREEKRDQRYREHVAVTVPHVQGGPPHSYEDVTPLRLDVHFAVGMLDPRERAVCLGLGRGDSLCEIACDLGCCVQTVRRTIDRIRRRFRQMGLKGWLEE